LERSRVGAAEPPLELSLLRLCCLSETTQIPEPTR
jgi:hypothetical protein